MTVRGDEKPPPMFACNVSCALPKSAPMAEGGNPAAPWPPATRLPTASARASMRRAASDWGSTFTPASGMVSWRPRAADASTASKCLAVAACALRASVLTTIEPAAAPVR